MKTTKLTPRTIFQTDFLKGKASAEPKRSSERISVQKKPKQKKQSQTIDTNGKNKSPPITKNQNIPSSQRLPEVLKFTANNIHDFVSKFSDTNKGPLFDSRHFKSNSGDHKDYMNSGNKPKALSSQPINEVSPVCRNSKQSFKPINPISTPGAERIYQKKRVLSYFDDLIRFSPQANSMHLLTD